MYGHFEEQCSFQYSQFNFKSAHVETDLRIIVVCPRWGKVDRPSTLPHLGQVIIIKRRDVSPPPANVFVSVTYETEAGIYGKVEEQCPCNLKTNLNLNFNPISI